jgi:hypothetical protein
MNDRVTHLQEIKDRVLAFAKERDWEQFHAPKNLSMAIATEAAELMEHFLWQSPDSTVEKPRCMMNTSAADIRIHRLLTVNMAASDPAIKAS